MDSIGSAWRSRFDFNRDGRVNAADELATQLVDTILKQVLALANDPDARVRFQVAFTLGELKDPRAVAALAQGTGTIKGTVRDRTTRDLLPGANIVVQGTSIGAASDAKGEFVIRNVPPGDQTLVASYVGYVAVTATATVTTGSTVTQDFTLTPTLIEGKEVVITAQAQGQLQAINQQLASSPSTSIITFVTSVWTVPL